MRQRFSLIFLLACWLVSCSSPQTTSPASVPASPAPTPTSSLVNNCIDARQPTPEANPASLFPPVDEKDHLLGKTGAYVTVLVYSDFQCATCAKLAALLNSFVQKYPEDLRVVFRHFPLVSLHDKALLAAQAAEAADRQGKFWAMHDFLFSKQAEWQKKTPAVFQKWLVAQAAGLGLDQSQFETDLTSAEIVAGAKKASEDGQKIQLPGVPVILINGEIIKWQPALFEQLESLILLARLPQKQFSTCPPVVIDPSKQYTARLKTSRGEVLIRLFVDRAPNTVNNFVFLAQQGWYDRVSFFRVVPDFVARTGDPTGTGLGGPGYFIPDEKSSLLQFDRAGMVGMVNAGPNTSGSQFFITLGPAPQLNQSYTIFGQVISGQEVLSRLTPRDPTVGGTLPEPDLLLGVTIEDLQKSP
jgi:cyclophilin family peptidyl-prolyl cis-trans isomerase/protein-disulfide isomerase